MSLKNAFAKNLGRLKKDRLMTVMANLIGEVFSGATFVNRPRKRKHISPEDKLAKEFGRKLFDKKNKQYGMIPYSG